MAANDFEGETLLTRPIPFEYLYTASVKQGPGWVSRRWQSKQSGDDDTYVVNIFAGQRQNLARFRQSRDKPGEESCDTFSSVILDRVRRSGYKSIFWRTQCRVGANEITSLQLGIDGRDRLYHIRKLWKAPVAAEAMAIWKAVISDISVCDTRNKKQSCTQRTTTRIH